MTPPMGGDKNYILAHYFVNADQFSNYFTISLGNKYVQKADIKRVAILQCHAKRLAGKNVPGMTHWDVKT